MSVSIKLNGSGLDFIADVTLFQATQIMAFIAQQGEAIDTPINLVTPPKTELLQDNAGKTTPSGTYDSPRSAIDELAAKSIPQKIVAIAFYLGATSQNGMILNFEDVLAEFTKAGAAKPTHFAREVKKTVSEGYVYLEGKSAFRLLSKTDTIPRDKFPKLKRKSSATRPKSSAPGEKLTVRPEITSMPRETFLDGYKDHFEITNRSDQILWILKYAAKHSFPSLNRREIVTISSHLGGKLTGQNFTSSNGPNAKNGYISTTLSQITLSAKGEAYVTQTLTK